jgi:hypothetical protein
LRKVTGAEGFLKWRSQANALIEPFKSAYNCDKLPITSGQVKAPNWIVTAFSNEW